MQQNEKKQRFNFKELKIINPSLSTADKNEPVLELIAGDASDRKFFRLVNSKKGNVICMQFPKWEGGYGGDPISWIGMHSALAKMNIPIPQILEIDETNACIWTEDLGNDFLNSCIQNKILDRHNPQCKQAILYYKNALMLLIHAQYPDMTIDHPASNRLFDFEKLYYELNFFAENFLKNFLNLDKLKPDFDWKGLDDDFRFLCIKLQNYPRVLCHRDYHVRNIMIKNNELFWIDFQDARMGPHSYDVVSILRDSYVDITWETREYLFSYYLSALNARRNELNLKTISFVDFHLESLLMGLQRNLKAIGSFGYLATKKQKSDYLKYVNQTLKILCSRNAQLHEETDIKGLLPHIFNLLENLYSGEFSSHLNNLIHSKCS